MYLKKLIFLIPILFVHVYILSQEWTRQSYEAGEHSGIRILHVDKDKNSYGQVAYRDTVYFPDTAFFHTGYHSNQNYAVPVFDKDGKFIKAFDFLTQPMSYLYNMSLVADDDLNVYVAAEFSVRVFINDTAIDHGGQPNPFTPEVFLIKINPNNKVEWIKLVSATTQDYCYGLEMSEDGHLYLAVGHAHSGTVTYLGQDTLEFSVTHNALLKIDLDGQIIWRKDITGTDPNTMLRDFCLREDGQSFLFGLTKGHVLIDGDTLVKPEDPMNTYWTYLVEINKDGEYVYGNIPEPGLGFRSYTPAPDDELFFSAILYEGTTVFGKDTLSLTSDSSARLFGRMSKSFEPVWYYQVRSIKNSLQDVFEIQYGNDSLFTAISARKTIKLGGDEYDLGDYQSSLLTSWDEHGKKGFSKVLKAQYGHGTFNFLLDNCNDVILGGSFAGMGWFENDTLTPNNHAFKDGFISRFLRSSGYSLELGNDTAIGMSHSIDIAATPGYDKYFWSTGDTTETIHLSGNVIDTGDHKIWCDAYMDKCLATDTLVLTVYDDTGIEEHLNQTIRVYPNPFTTTTKIEYQLKRPSDVTITLFNHIGEQLYIFQVHQQSGKQTFVWNAEGLPAGMYYFSLRAGKQTGTGKFVILR